MTFFYFHYPRSVSPLFALKKHNRTHSRCGCPAIKKPYSTKRVFFLYIFFDVGILFRFSPLDRSHRKWSSALHLKRFRSPVSIRIVARFRLSRYSSALAPCLRPAVPAIAWERVPREQRSVVTLDVRSLLLTIAPLSLPLAVRMARGLYFVLRFAKD